jgi:glycosyltransferase involved in cell wall biosynthesis
MLNLFYAEPDRDRWLPFDRYPRRLIRRLLRGPGRPGGQMRVFLNLVAGLDRLGVEYRVNDYRHASRHPDELCCVLGKRDTLDRRAWKNPLMVGPAVHSHPIDDPELLNRVDVRRILVPGEWMRRMCEPYWGERVHAWPVGIDTDLWAPRTESARRDLDFLVYDKLRWNRDQEVPRLLLPVESELRTRGLRFQTVRYGQYDPREYQDLLARCRGMVFLCEHETQGIAYQEALASGVPILAWDHAGAWTDPEYFPSRVQFSPVSSVPYWDTRCGVTYQRPEQFPAKLDEFLGALSAGTFDPRAYILENLTLEQAARAFVAHANAAMAGKA